ncbi:MAG: GGDEF domain-containing protein [Candidatus Acidiferrales bacterium]
MSQPSEPSRPQSSAEDCFLDLLAETLEGLEETVRGPFLQRFFKSFTQLELSEAQSVEAWAHVISRQKEFSEALGRRIALKTALVDVLGGSHFLRVPVLLEYEAYKKLQINAATDGLTGLYNRRLFDETCEKELNRAKRYNQPLAVVLFDLHRLKEVNDQYGHMKGDQVLQLAANNLRKTLRASDFAFRIGGDEFALLLPQTDPEQAATLCRRVRNNFEIEVAPLKMKVAVALDFGLSVYPQDADAKDDLVQFADERLYALKYSTLASRAIPIETPPAPSETPAPPRVTPAPARETPSAPRESLRETLREKIPPAASAPASSPRPTMPQAPAQPKQPAQPRKWERVSLSGTKSYAILDGSQRTASVIDLSYGGVALLFETNGALPEEFSAVLHVPILPPLRVSLRKAYAVSAESGHVRMGCAFVA